MQIVAEATSLQTDVRT